MSRSGICPTSASTGAFIEYAVSSAALALSRPGPGTTAKAWRLAGRERRTERHVGRALLVTRVNGPDAILRLEQCIEQMIVLHAGQRVDRVEPMGDEARNDRFGGGHLHHERVIR